METKKSKENDVSNKKENVNADGVKILFLAGYSVIRDIHSLCR